MAGYTVFNNFSAGELDPKLHARINEQLYQSGVKSATNMLADPLGPMVSRGGTRVIAAFEDVVFHKAKLAKQMNYGGANTPNSPSDSVVVLAGGEYGFLDITGMLANSDYINMPPDNLLEPDITSVLDASVVTDKNVWFYPGRIELRPPLDDTSELELLSSTNVLSYDPQDIRLNILFEEEQTSATEVTIGFLEDGSTYTTIAQYTGGMHFNKILCVERNSVTPSGSASSLFYVNIRVLPSAGPVAILGLSVGRSDANTMYSASGVLSPPGINLGNFPRWATDRYTGRLISMQSARIPKVLWYQNNVSSDNNADLDFSNPPSDWENFDYPTMCAFFQGRSWWSGSLGYPGRIWASQTYTSGSTEDWYNMDTGTGLDNEAIDIERDSFGRITNMVAATELIVLTEVDIFVLTSSTGTLTPSDIREVPQSGVGAAPIDPINLKYELIYVAIDYTRIVKIKYSDATRAWVTTVINNTALHLFKNKRIRRIERIVSEYIYLFVQFKDYSMVVGVYNEWLDMYSWQNFDIGRSVLDISVFKRYGNQWLIMLTDGYIGLSQQGAEPIVFAEVYDPDLLTDHTEYLAGPAGTGIPQTLNYQAIGSNEVLFTSIKRLLDADVAFSDIWETVTYGSISNSCVMQLEYVESENAYLFEGSFKTSWASGRRPKYFTLVLDYESAEIDAQLDIIITGVSGSVLLNATGVRSQNIISFVTPYEDEDMDTLSITYAGTNDSLQVTSVAIADTYEDIKKANQIFWAQGFGKPFQVVGFTKVTDNAYIYPIGSFLYNAMWGSAFTQEFETLQPVLRTDNGPTRGLIQSNANVNVGVYESGIPQVNDKSAKVNPDAETNDNDLTTGLVKQTVVGYTKQPTVKVTQLQPKSMTVREIIVETTQLTKL